MNGAVTHLRVYPAIAARSFRRYATYRGAVVAGVVVNTVFGFILAGILRSALSDGRVVGGMDRTTATAFTFVVQGLLLNVLAFGDFELAAKVLSGDVASDMVKPVDFSLYRLASDLGRSLYFLLARGVPPLVSGWLVFRFPLPSLPTFLGFLLTCALAAALASRLWTAVAVTAFWLTDGSGPVQFTAVLISVFGGLIVPLQFLPDAFATLARALPFVGLLQYPAGVFVGLNGIRSTVMHQVIWLIVLELVLRVELRSAFRKLVIQGG